MILNRFSHLRIPKRSLNVKLVCVNESRDMFRYSFLPKESLDFLSADGFTGKLGEYSVYPLKDGKVAFVGIGMPQGDSTRSAVSIIKLSSQVATAIGKLKQLKNDDDTLNIEIFSDLNVKESAEGAALGAYSFNKTDSGSLGGDINPDNSYSFTGDKTKIKISYESSEYVIPWKKGLVYSSAQNLARSLAEMPANKMTPNDFCKIATDLLSEESNVKVNIYDKNWIRARKMGAFLSVAQGSEQECYFLELRYFGASENKPPILLVGKGVTFDAGGISIKPSAGMALMKGDMAGAAVALSSFKAAVDLKLPINLITHIPLTENLINGRATKPGDVVTAINGKTIEIDNTDAEGRLLLADTIYYGAKKFMPLCIVELSTLTGAMDIALGYPFAGTFANSDQLWIYLESASKVTGDFLWRMPFHKEYLDQMKSQVADYKNVGGRSAGSCTAAAFLDEFASVKYSNGNVTKLPFAHIDIAGVFHKASGKDFLANGMTGRPTRTIIEFLKNLSKESRLNFSISQ